MAPDIVIACSADLWQLRSHSAIWSRLTLAIRMMRFDVDEPFVT